MNIECRTNQLVRVVEKSSRATGKNLSLPVLSCIYLDADQSSNSLNLRATNLEIGVDFKLKVKCLESGKAAVPGNILLNFLFSINPESDLKIVLDNGNLKISSKNNSSLIKCLPTEDFPNIPIVLGDKETLIKSKEFINGIKSVWYSASNSTIKPELASVYITAGEQELIFVSTDSFRLAEKKVYYKNPTDFQPTLLPYKNIPDIIKILDGFDGDLKLSFDKNQMSFSFGSGTLVSRIIDGSFPDYKQIIPQSPLTEVVVLKNDLVSTIHGAQVFSDAFNQIRFKIDPEARKFSIMTKNNDVGEFTEDIAAKISGDPIEISFNHKYILDAMQSINGESISLYLSGSGKPMIIKGAGDKSFTYIVMPMNR